MTTKEAKSQQTPTPIRMPDDLKKWLRHQAVDNSRSLNEEIIQRLQDSRTRELRAAKA